MTFTGTNPSSSALARFGKLALAAMMLAACTGPTANLEPADPTPTPPSGRSTASPPASVVAQTGALDEFLIRIWGAPITAYTQPDAQARAEVEHRWREEYISACMAQQGFTYHPNLDAHVSVQVIAGPLPGTRQFAEQFGFGISEDQPLPGDTPAVLVMGGSDPNQQIRAAMSDAELAAYQEALWGDPTVLALANQEGVLPDFSKLGCWGAAIGAQVTPPGDDEFSVLAAEVKRFTASIEVAPDIIALNAQWAACLTDQGHPGLLSPTQLRDSLADEWLLVSDPAAGEQLVLDWDWQASPDGPPGWVVGEDGVGRLVTGTDAEAAFREREFALALADVACREQLNFDYQRTEISHQLQQQFVAENQDELEAWAAFAESQRDVQ